jgi:cytochrome c2
VVDRLKSSGATDVDKQIAELTAGLSPKDSRIEKLIAQRRAGFLAGTHDGEAGRAIFAKSVCANCHKIGEVGKTIGPGLDGTETVVSTVCSKIRWTRAAMSMSPFDGDN